MTSGIRIVPDDCSLSRKMAGIVFDSNSSRCSRRAERKRCTAWDALSMFCGGSVKANKGCSLGKTVVNSSFDKVLDISKTLGRMNGKRYESFIYNQPTLRRRLTSSSKLGRILPFLNRSEKEGSTLTSPRKNVAFSSRGLDAKVVASRKLRVEMASDEKKECEGSDAILSRFEGCRVSSRGSRSVMSPHHEYDPPLSSWLHLSHLDPDIQSLRVRLPSA